MYASTSPGPTRLAQSSLDNRELVKPDLGRLYLSVVAPLGVIVVITSVLAAVVFGSSGIARIYTLVFVVGAVLFFNSLALLIKRSLANYGLSTSENGIEYYAYSTRRGTLLRSYFRWSDLQTPRVRIGYVLISGSPGTFPMVLSYNQARYVVQDSKYPRDRMPNLADRRRIGLSA
jgi:hypothetical protein